MKDVIIIGSGPIGLACGIEAQKKGLEYLILEKGILTNSIYNYPTYTSFFSTSEKLEIGDIPFISHNPKPTRAEALEYYRRVTMHFELLINFYEEVIFFVKKKQHFFIKTSKSTYKTKNIILATGFFDIPCPINIPGENLSKVTHYYKSAHPYFGMDIVIVGAGNSAVDVALETYRSGAKSVTMVVREKELGKNIKYWVRPDIINRIEEKNITAYFNSTLKKITPDKVVIKTPKKEITLKNDFILAMTGYQPDFSLLQSLGIQFQNDFYKTPVYNSNTMETNIKNVYLAGVVCGGLKTNQWFIENSRAHAVLIMKNITKTKKIN